MPKVTNVEVISSSEVQITIDELEQRKDYTITLNHVIDDQGNFLNPSYNSINFKYTQNTDIVVIPYDFEFGSIIELYLCGIPTLSTIPTIVLKIDDVAVATFQNVYGVLEQRNFRYNSIRYYYVHYQKVSIDQIKLEYTNDVWGGPNKECLHGWALGGGSTAVPSYHYLTPYNYITLALTGTSGDPSELNSLRYDLLSAAANRPITVSADMLAPVGTQGRVEFWTTDGVPALQESLNINGTGEWTSSTLSEVTLAGDLQFNTQVRLITNSPDTSGTYTNWKNVSVDQELIDNGTFDTVLTPWYVHSGSNVTPTLMEEGGVHFVRTTLIGVSPPDISHYNSIVQHIGFLGIDDGTKVDTGFSFRAPVGTVARVGIFALPWGSTVVSVVADFNGTGDWVDLDLATLVATEYQNDLELRLTVYSPNQAGTYVDWTNASVVKNLIENGTFVDRSVYVDKVVVDGYSYETESDTVYSTGTWTPGDGDNPSAGFKSSEVLTNNGYFDFSYVDDEALFAGVDTRIDTYRKGNCNIVVKNASDDPVVNAEIVVQQTNHEFLFGCNLFHWPMGIQSSDPAAVVWGAHTEPLTDAEQLLSDNYRARWLELFNFATVPFYWVTHEMTEGHPADSFKGEWLQWCIDNNVKTKGHTLFWTADEPDWLAPKTLAEAKTAILTEVSRTIAAQTGKVDYWDVINESSFEYYLAYLHTVAPKSMAVWEAEGHYALLNEVMQLAKSVADPTTKLMLNDYDVSDAYFNMLSALDPSTFDEIGIQSHFHEEVWSNQKIWHVCNRFGAIKPVHLSEVSVLSGFPYTNGGARLTNLDYQDIVSWPTTTGGEARQMAEVVRFYKMVFSNPYVNGITWWDITDYQTWLNAPRGLIGQDMSPKPAFYALKDLIKNEWWTSTTLTSNGSGAASFRGFAGEYTVTIKINDQPVKVESKTLTTAGNTWTITI